MLSPASAADPFGSGSRRTRRGLVEIARRVERFGAIERFSRSLGSATGGGGALLAMRSTRLLLNSKLSRRFSSRLRLIEVISSGK
jgi:hypothetical protein